LRNDNRNYDQHEPFGNGQMQPVVQEFDAFAMFEDDHPIAPEDPF
jgi:hypothetical protein